MRFHHSTRRGRNRLGQHSQILANNSNRPTHHSTFSTSRWSQLGYCRDTNIHFNRRLPVEPPEPTDGQQQFDSQIKQQYKSAADLRGNESAFGLPLVSSQLKSRLEEMTATTRAESSPSSPTNKSSRRRADSGFFGSTRRQQQQDLDDRLNKLSLNDHSPTSKSNHRRAKNQQRRQQNAPQVDFAADQAPKIDLESAREKLVAQVEKHPFWSNKAAKRMQLTGLEERRIYIYELISFCERRELEWRYEPYKGGLMASAAPFRRPELLLAGNGCPASSWSQPATPTGRGKTLMSERLPLVPPLGARNGTLGKQLGREGPPLSLPATVASSGDSFWTGATGGSGVSSPVGGGNSKRASTATEMGRPVTTSGLRLSGHSPIRRSASSSSPTGRHSQLLLLSSPGGEYSQASSPPSSPIGATIAAAGQLSSPSLKEQQAIPSADFVWSIEAPAQVRPEAFSGCVHVCELPESSFVKRCHGCQGRGKLKCTSCYGVGYEVCLGCSGKGTTKSHLGSSSGLHGARSGGYHSSDQHSIKNARGGIGGNYDNDHDSGLGGGLGASSSDHGGGRWRGGAGEPGGITSSSGSAFGGGAWVSESCHYCHGAGQKRCWICAGKAYNFCLGCAGSGQLRCYLNLNISWLNHRDESILNNSDNIIPRERLRQCSGQLRVDETAGRLECLARTRLDSSTGKPEESNQLHSVSKKLLEKHWQTYGRQERLLKQRQKVTQVECHVVSYDWKQRRGSFVIYGAERKVYIAKYPFKSFCSIT